MSNAYLYHHHDTEGVSFSWDGTSPTIIVSGGGLSDPHSEAIPLVGSPLTDDTAIGWLLWFQSICEAHIRMRLAAGEPIVRPL